MTVLPGKKKRSSLTRVRTKGRVIKRFVRNILLTVNIVLVIALLLAYLSVYLNPATTAFPALFGLAYPYLVAANIIMVVVWVLFRKWFAPVSYTHLRAHETKANLVCR